MPSLDTYDVDSVAGALYFIVGRGTEGGTSSYQLSVAGITYHGPHSNWGKSGEVADNSGYSIGSIQVDLGQRGEWPIGATQYAPLKPGQTTYVDGLIVEAARYARKHHLEFTSDTARLRVDLLTHGDGKGHHGTLVFIDAGTRDAFNAWASSEDGAKWIHRNIDYPQVRNATGIALDMLEADGRNIPEDRRLETLAILAKTANQMPGQLAGFRKVLQSGGDYEDVLAKANDIKRRRRYYAGPEAAAITERYKSARTDVVTSAALDRAQARVASADFNPSADSTDPDIQKALRSLGQGRQGRVLRHGSHGDQVAALQADLAGLGVTDAHGLALHPDGVFGPSTQAAVETFQRTHGLQPDGLAGPETLRVLQQATRQQTASLADASHPGNPMFCQALERVHVIDAQHGRAPDTLSNNLAGLLATAAYAQGLTRIDHVMLGDDAARAFAVQGDPRSPARQVACVDVMQAMATPLEQSSAEFLTSSQPGRLQQANSTLHQPPLAQPALPGLHR